MASLWHWAGFGKAPHGPQPAPCGLWAEAGASGSAPQVGPCRGAQGVCRAPGVLGDCAPLWAAPQLGAPVHTGPGI